MAEEEKPFDFFEWIGLIIVAYWNAIPDMFNYYAQYTSFFGCASFGMLGVFFAGDRGYTYNYCENFMKW